MTPPLSRSLAAALAALPLLASGACTRATARPAAAEDDAAILVRLAPVEPGPVQRPVRAAGSVSAKREWDLAFKVGGVLARILVEEGAAVRKGQLLAALDRTELSASVRQAREALAKARRDSDRASFLAASDTLPRAAAEDARTAVALAEATLAAAEFNARHAVLVAPDDGWVDGRMAEPGEVVAPGRPVIHLSGRGGGFVVRASLADRDVLGLAPGAPAIVTLDARPDAPLRGQVAEIARSAAPGTGTFAVEISLDAGAPGLPLLAGLSAKVEIPRTVPAVGTVPLAAIVDGDGEGGAVFAIEGDRARRVPVRIAFLQGERVVLAGGVESVEQVVAEGAARLSDGVRVHVTP